MKKKIKDTKIYKEEKRGCGWRQVGGTYLVGAFKPVKCDRLPFPIDVCPCCGHGLVGRGMARINPLKMFGTHDIIIRNDIDRNVNNIEVNCTDDVRPCWLCDPTDEPAYLMGVGEKFYPTPRDFMDEGLRQGFSKRINGNSIPRDLIIGKTVVYLSHPKAVRVKKPVEVLAQASEFVDNTLQPKLLDAEAVEYKTGIFTAFIPQRIEKIYWQSQIDKMSDKEKESLAKRGITPVGVPDGDKRFNKKGQES